jgi:VIT1/CCC1 family predicted Fe2+/Mn2+ transporter
MKLQHSIQVGLSFGLTSGVITTLGLVVGLAAGTASRLAVLGGIVTIAVADSLSDALGIHVSEESESIHTQKEIWASTLATFASKLVMALSFAVPVLVFDLNTAVVASVAWGVLALAALSYHLARLQGGRAWPVVTEHLAVAAAVIAISHFVGRFINSALS